MSKHHNMSGRQARRSMATLYLAQGGRCAHCNKPMIDPDEARAIAAADPGAVYPDHPTLDHVVPRSLRGVNALTNLLLAHSRCNHRRGARKLRGFALVMRRQVLGWLEQAGHPSLKQRDAA